VLLAVGAEVLARRLHIPAIVILLPAGFTAGALTPDVNPEHLLGPAFHPLVELAVAVILYEDALGLDLRELTGPVRRIAVRMTTIGAALTWILGSFAAALLLGMSRAAAVITGVILVVSGPMVVGPLLRLVRPAERLRQVLAWEASLIDPIGAILAAVVFDAIIAGKHEGFGGHAGQFLASLGLGLVDGAIGVLVLWLLLGRRRLPEALGANLQFAVVVVVAGFSNILRDESGLIAAVVIGLAVGNIRAFDTPARRPFFETLGQLIGSLLFVGISATVTPESLRHLVLPSLGVAGVLVLIARPLATVTATAGTDLRWNERGYVGCIAPKGIIAAATASAFAASLTAANVGGAEKLLPVTFVVIVATVVVYSLTAVPVARQLGVVDRERSRPLLVGGAPWVVDLGRVLATTGLDVLMWAGTGSERDRIRLAGLDLAEVELLAFADAQEAELQGVTAVFLLSAADDFNGLAARILDDGADAAVYRLRGPAWTRGNAARSGGELLFGPGLTGSAIAGRIAAGARLIARPADQVAPGEEMLFLVRGDGQLDPVTATSAPAAGAEGTAVVLTGAGATVPGL
jgi:NhaP-type Na+/H+ or K+/H+ antiporter